MADAREIEFEVEGYPPAKGEAQSMLGERHSHAPRVRLLLQRARERAQEIGFDGFGEVPLGLDLTLTCLRNGDRSDATNYLGGVADVLEDKAHRGRANLAHLGDLAHFGLYANDRQIEAVQYRWESASAPSYRVRVWALEN